MLKLYVWRGDDVLRLYSSGIAFALADSTHQAQNLLYAKLKERHIAIFGAMRWGDEKEFRDKISWLYREPEIYDQPTAQFLEGGE